VHHLYSIFTSEHIFVEMVKLKVLNDVLNPVK